jgi:eukaryotic-like serine/threonine-protein kinase
MKYCSTCNEKFDDSLSFCPTDGEVLEEDSSSLVGKILDGQYQIEALLGKGGMGAVYRARHILLGDRVAIKVLPPEMRSNSEWLRRFQREGQAARRFRHPNAVTVYDLRTSGDGTIYLVMEYVEGTTLDSELKRHGRFSPAEAVSMLSPIMSVLNAAHAMGVVHRDLKPENIMIGKLSTGGESVVKLLDLGIAKLREVAGAERTGNTNLTIAGQMLGTPYYMSPEQWGELPRDGNAEIDGRADIYSLGVVLHELISGRKPFTGATLSELRRQHVAITTEPLPKIVPGVSEAFANAVARAMAKDRSDRQATAAQLETELKDALAAEGISPSPSLLSETMFAPSVAPGPDAPPRGVVTAAERTAPTMLSEAAATDARVPAPSPQMMASQIPTAPTMVVSEQELARRAAERAKEFPSAISQAGSVASVPAYAAPPQKRSPFIFIGVGVVILLVVLGAGGFAVFHFLGSSAKNSPAASANDSGKPDAALAAHEIGRYWVELDTRDKANALHAGDPIELQSGQSFKIVFSPNENGYLYIVGPGADNAPTTFLTAKPSAGSGLTTNEVSSGTDFKFPADKDSDNKANFLTLDMSHGTDEFTMVFAPTPITTPAFFAGDSEHQLTSAEKQEWESFRNQYKASATNTVIKSGAKPFVAVKVPQTDKQTTPVVFEVRIQHK